MIPGAEFSTPWLSHAIGYSVADPQKFLENLEITIKAFRSFGKILYFLPKGPQEGSKQEINKN